MARPRIDDDGGLKELVEEYADENGLKMPRAWADLVRAGLIHKEPDFLDDYAVEEGQ